MKTMKNSAPKLLTMLCASVLSIFALASIGYADSDEVTICHVPPGNPSNPQTLEISEHAVSAHIGVHAGDHLGACTSDDAVETSEVETPETTSSGPVNANCVAFSTAVTQETALKDSEDKLKNDEDAFKETEDELKDSEDELKAQAIEDGDSVAAAEHETKSQEYETKSQDHEDKSKNHEDASTDHAARQQGFASSTVPAGMTSCTTPGGSSGFLPSASAGIVSSPVPKALREISGQ
ncbi:MAG: hypothetical protein Q9M26_08730 [Mariprofundales bacterium]|nr:hypothetical protein [Mariprofundales bacterium]